MHGIHMQHPSQNKVQKAYPQTQLILKLQRAISEISDLGHPMQQTPRCHQDLQVQCQGEGITSHTPLF